MKGAVLWMILLVACSPRPEAKNPVARKTVSPVENEIAKKHRKEDATPEKTKKPDRQGCDCAPAPPPPPPVGAPGEEIYTAVDEPAEFPGGIMAMRKYLAEKLRYPTCLQEDIETKCYVRFIVGDEGVISNVELFRGSDCPECDKDALRVVKQMPDWKPAKVDGKNVRCFQTFPIRFNYSVH